MPGGGVGGELVAILFIASIIRLVHVVSTADPLP
jgi:hypothetical protein